MPEKHHHSAGDHARNRALLGRAAPVQGEQRQRAEARAETCPRIRHDVEDDRVFIPCHEAAEHEHGSERDARNDENLVIGRVFLEHAAEDVFRH